MDFYIQIIDGQPINHPIINFHQAFPNIDAETLANNFAVFRRVEMPTLDRFEVYEGTTYEWEGDIVVEKHNIRPMTAEEKLIRQQAIKDSWARRPNFENFSAWTFDEATSNFVPPIPRPEDDKKYFWQGITNSWVERPPYPDDGKEYRLDFNSATWVEVTA
jgi:hypothetical protein